MAKKYLYELTVSSSPHVHSSTTTQTTAQTGADHAGKEGCDDQSSDNTRKDPSVKIMSKKMGSS